MKKKFYAIRKGYDSTKRTPVTNLILEDWGVASTYVQGITQKVHGVSPEYKSFKTLKDAEDYLNSDPLLHKSEMRHSMTALHCYVDGSFSEESANYSFGNIYVLKGIVKDVDLNVGNNAEAVTMQQIGGELLGAIMALKYAKSNGYKDVVIFHDYVGVCYHALEGNWKQGNKFSVSYHKWIQSFFTKNPDITVTFCKVDAHSGDDFNEIADGLAKLALNVPQSTRFRKLIDFYSVKPMIESRGYLLETPYGQ